MKINVVLYEPEIPQNTGNIIRTCVATNTKLHLIEPLGFDLYKRDVKRSTANHLEGLEYEVYPDFETFLEKNNNPRMFFSTRYAHKPHSHFDYQAIEEDIFLVFGKESAGIPYELLHDHLEDTFRLPMASHARSLNLSNCVAIVVYEVLRQLDYPDLSMVEVQKGADFLK